MRSHAYLLHHFAVRMLFFFPIMADLYVSYLITTLVVFSLINYRFSNRAKKIFLIFLWF